MYLMNRRFLLILSISISACRCVSCLRGILPRLNSAYIVPNAAGRRRDSERCTEPRKEKRGAKRSEAIEATAVRRRRAPAGHDTTYHSSRKEVQKPWVSGGLLVPFPTVEKELRPQAEPPVTPAPARGWHKRPAPRRREPFHTFSWRMNRRRGFRDLRRVLQRRSRCRSCRRRYCRRGRSRRPSYRRRPWRCFRRGSSRSPPE